jgi:hypothetical protein
VLSEFPTLAGFRRIDMALPEICRTRSFFLRRLSPAKLEGSRPYRVLLSIQMRMQSHVDAKGGKFRVHGNQSIPRPLDPCRSSPQRRDGPLIGSNAASDPQSMAMALPAARRGEQGDA